ncbi:MAG: glutamate synthase subunit beta [Candidatus Omnitrophica bacterium]|nr:glutamate synthase subunit beta [Candidatus Omnitrophota bacterium]
MGDVKGFLKTKRASGTYRPVCERVKDYREVASVPAPERAAEQGSRCMDCGTPFCHWGCPISNYIPEWNDALFRKKTEKALRLLSATNNFPEITGRVCPALCEYACVLGINDDPVTIRENELSVIEQAFKAGLIKPTPPDNRTGKRVAIVGSGPAGLSCADQLNRAGHHVTVFERDAKAGGILRYGIPDFKLEKSVIDRRLSIFKSEGIEFRTGTNVGVDIRCSELLKDFDAVVMAGGSRVARDLKIEGRELKGIYQAMEYLMQSNRRVAGEIAQKENIIDTKSKKVVVIGGGDTGSDCIGTAIRQGASCVVQLEILPKPADKRQPEKFPWPSYPVILKTSTSHEEGADRHWSASAKRLVGENGTVKKLVCYKADSAMKEIPGTEFDIETDLVILAMGFVRPEHHGLVSELGLGLDQRGNVKTDASYVTSMKKVFACGDMRRGQSLVVWAIAEGRACAENISRFLNNSTL